MKTAILCISDAYLVRGRQLMEFYQNHGDEVRILTPDFSHRLKEPVKQTEDNVVFLPHRPYYKNLSPSRLIGHAEFAKECRLHLEQWQPQRIHCLIPANALAVSMGRYKKEHPDVQLIFDVNDLWPESLPIPGFMHTPFAWYWKSLRSSHMKQADILFAECGLFAGVIEKEAEKPVSVLYWSPGSTPAALDADDKDFSWNDQEVSLCYLGSMNNILDIDWTAQFVKNLALSTSVRVHLIGSGEKKEKLTEALKQAGALVEDHGEIFDPAKKQEIFDACRFGLNVMKPMVSVGLSMKSLDYLQAGLPLISSLQGDTKNWIHDYGIGLQAQSPSQSAQAVLKQSRQEHLKMRSCARKFFDQNLSADAFRQTLEKTLFPA